jgi:hypothetical protein
MKALREAESATVAASEVRLFNTAVPEAALTLSIFTFRRRQGEAATMGKRRELQASSEGSKYTSEYCHDS